MAEDQDRLVGRAIGYSFIAAGGIGLALVMDVLIGSGASSLGTLLGPTGLLGALAGYTIGGLAMSRVHVAPSHLVLTNLWFRTRIERDAIASLSTASGIRVVLRNGERISSTAFAPSLGKVIVGNHRAKRFATAMADVLDVNLDQQSPERSAIPDGSAVDTFRVDATIWIAGCGAASATVAAVIRVVTSR